MRILYTLLVYLALPWTPLKLWWRGRREPDYRQRIGERYGRYAQPVTRPVLWLHAVSLGETRAAVPLVDRLLRAYPEATVLITHMTATGRAAGRGLFGDRVIQAWLPYDAPFAVSAFLRHFKPRAGLIMETELWPNLVALAHHAGVPLYLVNARMSQRSAARYACAPLLSRPMLEAFSGIAAQTKSDATRLAALGAPRAIVTGNLKFDATVPEAGAILGSEFRLRFGKDRPTWVAGATREGEETLILDALAEHSLPPDSLTVIVPRHPQRFAAVAELLRQRTIPFVLRSSNEPVTADTSVVLGDSMGEMSGYFAAADVVFIGGSLKPLGGHNLIEPIAAGRPTLVGPHMFNFAEATANALAAGAAVQVADAAALMAEVSALFNDAPRRLAIHRAALAFHEAHRGAVERLWTWLAPQLAQAMDGPLPVRGGDITPSTAG